MSRHDRPSRQAASSCIYPACASCRVDRVSASWRRSSPGEGCQADWRRLCRVVADGSRWWSASGPRVSTRLACIGASRMLGTNGKTERHLIQGGLAPEVRPRRGYRRAPRDACDNRSSSTPLEPGRQRTDSLRTLRGASSMPSTPGTGAVPSKRCSLRQWCIAPLARRRDPPMANSAPSFSSSCVSSWLPPRREWPERRLPSKDQPGRPSDRPRPVTEATSGARCFSRSSVGDAVERSVVHNGSSLHRDSSGSVSGSPEA